MGFRAPVELIPISTHVPLVPHLILFPTLLAAAPDRGRNLFFLQLQVQSHPRSLLPTLPIPNPTSPVTTNPFISSRFPPPSDSEVTSFLS